MENTTTLQAKDNVKIQDDLTTIKTKLEKGFEKFLKEHFNTFTKEENDAIQYAFLKCHREIENLKVGIARDTYNNK